MINHNIEVIALLSGAALGDLDWLNLVVFGDSRGLGGQGGGGGGCPQSPEVCAAGEPDDFKVKNYLEYGLELPTKQQIQKIYIKMFGSNATIFPNFVSYSRQYKKVLL